MSYTSQTKIQNFLQRQLNDYEVSSLVMIIPAIEQWIDRRTGSTFDKVDTATTRKYSGGSCSIDIDPCTEVTDIVHLNEYGDTDYTYVIGQDYTLEPANETVKREIVKRNGYFGAGEQRIAVTAKFSEWDGSIPMDIQVVATRLAAAIIRAAKNDAASGGIKNESLEGHSISYITSMDDIGTLADGDPFIKSVLNQRSEILVG